MGDKGGRPRKAVDPDMLERLAACGCTVAEIAAVLQCNKRTLERRFAEAVETGRFKGRSSLRHKQFQLAMKGDKTMLIWLGKQLLGQTEKVELSRTQVKDLLDEIEKVVKRHVKDPAVQQAIEQDWDQIRVD